MTAPRGVLLTPVSRTDLLELIPRSDEVAEVGTYHGHFAEDIVKRAAPRRLHVIDPWGGQDDEYAQTYNLKRDLEVDYQEAIGRLGDYIEAGQVAVHRAYSVDAAETFAERSLDWVYIDAMHTYDGCLGDLRAFAPKVRDDGFILGHDFSNTSVGRKMNFGVVDAVRTFLAETGYELVAVTIEAAPTYVIAKSSGAARDAFVEALVSEDFRVVQVDPEAMFGGFDQVPFKDAAGGRRQLFRLGSAHRDDAHPRAEDERRERARGLVSRATNRLRRG
jgi:hypothetical protein